VRLGPWADCAHTPSLVLVGYLAYLLRAADRGLVVRPPCHASPAFSPDISQLHSEAGHDAPQHQALYVELDRLSISGGQYSFLGSI